MTNYDDAFSTRPFTMRLIITQNSQNIGANTSVVGWRLRVIRTGNYQSYSSSGNSYSVKVNGTTVGSGSWTYDFRGTSIGDYIDIDSGTRTITHDADGTKSISVYASATGSSIGSAAKSGTFTLTTISRASTPTFEVSGSPVTSIAAGSAVDIITNRASTDFTHTISYNFGSQSGSIDTGVGDSTSWTPPVTLLTEIPNALSGSVSIITDTFDGATLIGSSTVSLTLLAGASAVPDFGTVTHAEATVSPDVDTIVGAYVTGITTLSVAITSPVGYQGSTIVSQKIEVINPSGTVTQTILSGSGTTAPISWNGSGTLRGTVTDSRGKSYSEDISITVMNYTVPNIAVGTKASRANSGGTVSPSGTYIRVDLVASVQSLVVGTQKNDLKYRVRIKETSDSTAWASVSPAASSTGTGSTAISSEVHPGIYSVANSYKVRVEIEDNLGSVSAVELTVGTGGALLHLSAVYDSIGVGGYYTGTANGEIMATGRIYQRGGNKVIDETDAATDTTKGIVELATTTEVLTGTDTTRAVTPAGLVSARDGGTFDTRYYTETEINTKFQPVAQGSIPSSVVVGSGSASVSSDGTVTFSGCSSVSLNGVFNGSAGDMYDIYFTSRSSNTDVVLFRLRAAGVDSTTGYDTQRGNATITATQALQALNVSYGFIQVTASGAANWLTHGRLTLFSPGRTEETVAIVDALQTPNPMTATTGVGRTHHGILHRATSAYDGMTLLWATGLGTGTVKVVKVA